MYASPEWAALGFAVMDPVLHGRVASKLKLKKKPSTSDLVTLLKRSPPGDEATARQWFEVLSRRVSGRISNLYPFESVLNFSHCLVDFSPAELRELPGIPFVPVKSTGDKNITKILQPIQCFLG